MGSNDFIKKINIELKNRNEDFIIINCFEVFQEEKVIILRKN